MASRLLADLVVLAHFAYILFVVAGGLAVLRRPRLAWLHLAAVAWGATIEFTGWICPLTPLEVTLAERGGRSGYAGGFVDHYIGRLIYPEGLTRREQWVLGAAVVALNACVYATLLLRRRAASPPG